MREADTRVVAVDLGASSGRVHVADFAGGGFDLREVGRFPNGGIRLGPRLYWDVLALYKGILDGVGAAGRGRRLASVGIDSWAVDYGLLRADGTLLDNPVHHRDQRTAGVFERVTTAIGVEELYRRTGIALQPFNTIYQLAADHQTGRLGGASTALLIPDLLSFFLTGRAGAELTNASTTQLLGLDGEWDTELLGLLGVDLSLLAPLRRPGDPAGELDVRILDDLGIDGPVRVTAVASHDTASAVVAVPTASADFAYISCGTWSLVGVEVEEPVVTDGARRAGFTNEGGIDGTYRFLRNVMGLWLLQESVRAWQRRGPPVDLAALTQAAAASVPLRSVIDPDASVFLPPGDMPERITQACIRGGEPAPRSAPEVTRCILDSLALAYRRAIEQAAELTGTTVEVVHVVGGGVNNRVLCQLTADACGKPVVAGPVEAAAAGNAIVQGRALGLLTGDRWSLRRFVADHVSTRRYEPDPAGAERFALASGRARPGQV